MTFFQAKQQLQIMKNCILITLITATLTFTGCSHYGYVSLNFPTEPVASLPEHINSLALVNRSLTKEEDKTDKLVESIVTGEIGGSDERASDESLRGAFDQMNGMYGLRLTIPQNNKLYGSGTRKVPELLDWSRVESICKESEADALLVLETFDSNSDLPITAVTESVNSLLSGRLPDPTAPRRIRMNVVCYWRLYDPANRELIDQYQHTSFMTFDTYAAIPSFDALPKTAYFAGEEYAFRYLPGYYKEKRKLYSKAKGHGKDQFKVGYRQSEVANWEDAIESWKAVTEVAKPKSSGKACLNIAVSYEVLGNTDEALKWARRAYEEYDDELAKTYAKTLLRRKSMEF